VAACRQSGVSLAAVALSRGLNANLLRRWVLQAELAGTGSSDPASMKALPAPMQADQFLPISMPASSAYEEQIRVEVRRGTTAVTVHWPTTAARECAAWLRKLLR
jgi:transposase-like protein